MLRSLLKLLGLTIIVSPFVLLSIIWFGLAPSALEIPRQFLSTEDIQRAKQILHRNDPRGTPAGTVRQVRLDERDLNLVTLYLLKQFADGQSQVSLEPQQVRLTASLRVQSLLIRPYLNIQLALLSVDARQLRVSELRIGSLQIPPLVANWIAEQIIEMIANWRQIELGRQAIKQIAFHEQQLLVRYAWHPELIREAKDLLMSDIDQHAVAVYHETLLRLQSEGIGRRGPLWPTLAALFRLTEQRSQTNDPTLEARSLLTVLGAWATGRGMGKLLPDRRARLDVFMLRLQGRRDLAQHFLASAALAARGDAVLSDAIGLFKELSDASGGSGFSFADIAADRAGTRFGETATASENSARRLQQMMASATSDSVFMPSVSGLPENMSNRVFEQRFGGVEGDAYKQLMWQIEQRIAARPLYR